MVGKTEQMLATGFAGWDYIRPEFVAELRAFCSQDRQLYWDLRAAMERAQAGTCRRKMKHVGVDADGDWDSPMALSRLDLGEIRLPKHHRGWLLRLYVSAAVSSPGTMLALLLGDKSCNGHDNAALAATQNQHIREAEVRLGRSL